MDIDKLKSIIESVLFVSGEPVNISRLAKICEVPEDEVENAMVVLGNDYAARGLKIIRKENDVQMASSSENAVWVEGLIKSEIQEALSQAALEVLSIVSYRGPISRIDIEAIRGVNCSFTLRSLMMRGLLERVDNPKDQRGYLYKISIDFLKKLGVENVEKLPDWEDLRRDERVESIINKE